MFGIGSTEILVIAVVGLLVLGPRKLPQIAKTVAKGMAQFRRVSTDLQRTVEREVEKEEENLRKEETKKDLFDKKENKPVPEQTAETQTAAADEAVGQAPEAGQTAAAPQTTVAEDATELDGHDAAHDAEIDAVSPPAPGPVPDETAVTAQTPPTKNTASPDSTEVSKA